MTANTAIHCHGSNQNTDCHCHTPIGVAVGSDGARGAEQLPLDLDTTPTPAQRVDMVDPAVAARLRAAADARVQARITAANTRTQQAKQSRQDFAERRRHGLHARHATREARLRLTDRHQTNAATPTTANPPEE